MRRDGARYEKTSYRFELPGHKAMPTPAITAPPAKVAGESEWGTRPDLAL